MNINIFCAYALSETQELARELKVKELSKLFQDNGWQVITSTPVNLDKAYSGLKLLSCSMTDFRPDYTGVRALLSSVGIVATDLAHSPSNIWMHPTTTSDLVLVVCEV